LCTGVHHSGTTDCSWDPNGQLQSVQSGAGCSPGKGWDGFTSEGINHTALRIDVVILQFA
jgi:hypothetical protein